MTELVLQSLRKTFGQVEALAGADLTVRSGGHTAVVGPSGCGKTTLLRLIAGFETPDAGTIRFDGEPLADVDARAAVQVPAHRRNVGIVAQDGCLFPHLSVADNICFGMKADRAAKAARATELMDMVGLDRSMLSRRPDALSGGQQQRVALARALAARPRLMLLDEPFSALDTSLRAATRKAVSDVLSAAGITTILVTHDQAEALAFADQLVVMRAGRFAQVGSPRDIYLRPVDAQTAGFMGEAIVLPARLSAAGAETALGLLAVDANGLLGNAEVMLRPEQILVVPAQSSAPASVGMRAGGPDGAGETGGAGSLGAAGNPGEPSRSDQTGKTSQAGGGATGKIVDIVFCGPRSDIAITLDNSFCFRLEVSSRSDLTVGDRVRLEISGMAHVFR